MDKICKIVGSSSLRNLARKQVHNDIALIKNVGFENHKFINHPEFLSKHIFVEGCDKNYVYYYVNHTNFPNLEELYLMSHPCEPNTLWRFYNKKVYLSDFYKNYKKRWAPENENLIILSHDEMLNMLNSYKEEPVKI